MYFEINDSYMAIINSLYVTYIADYALWDLTVPQRTS